MDRIPIQAAKDIAMKYDCREIIIWALDRKSDEQSVVTFGRTVKSSDHASQKGVYIKKVIFGWPASDAEADPSRVQKLKNRVRELEAEVSSLKATMGRPLYVKEKKR